MSDSNYVRKGKEAFDSAMVHKKKGDLKTAEAEFESAKGFLEAHQTIENDPEATKLGEQAKGWVYFTKGSLSMDFAKEAERLEEPKVATASYRKAYNQFFQALEVFTSVDLSDEVNTTRGYMNMSNGLSFSAEGDLAFDHDEYTKSVTTLLSVLKMVSFEPSQAFKPFFKNTILSPISITEFMS